MSSKLINLSVGKCLLSVVTLSLLMPAVVFANNSSDNIGVSLQVVPKCNIPNVSNAGLSQSEYINQQLDIRCSAQARPAEIEILAMPGANQTVNTPQVFEHQNDALNILVTY
jgi:hypothetical protein